MLKKTGIIILFLATVKSSTAQNKDTVNILSDVKVTGYRTLNGIGRFKDYNGQIIYAGKKNEVIVIDSLDANKAVNNTRQIIGRIPGANITETETGGFTANGIGFRGLNPYQSIETNTRQNGYNISADIFGYNEAYYLPPMEAVSRIEFVRGASALQFGPQIGGYINYVLKEGANVPFLFSTSQTIGSNGLFNSFNSFGGTKNKWKYYGFLQYRSMQGWRQNSDQTQLSGFASVKYDVTDKLQIGAEYTFLRNRIHMPGGLTDELFKINPDTSVRARNWLESPWNIISANLKYAISKNTSLSFITSYLFSQRNLVWRNEDGWPEEMDTITPDQTYVPRELEREYFKSTTNEFRFLTNYKLGNNASTLSTGIRFAYSDLKRQEGADGTTGSDFDLTQLSDWEVNMDFHTTNIAPFVENIFRFGKQFTVTPGLRFEYLETTANGYSKNEAQDSQDDHVYANDQKSSRKFLLPGLGLQYKISDAVNMYANYSKSFRPITYSDLTPFGTIAKIDPNLKDNYGDNFDLGIRGYLHNVVNFDISGFYLKYYNRIGQIEKTDGTETYLFRTNTGTSEHYGLESYVEVNISNLANSNGDKSTWGGLSIYNSLAYVHAKYTEGEFKGNYVEYAPNVIDRVGIRYAYKGFSANAQYSFTAKQYGDAANTVYSPDALVGILPSYQVIDFSASYKVKNYQFRFGVNNLANERYFTLRTSEYPGPGIIPSAGRTFYAGIAANF
jgi:Fe(3+) dicitrate transport protein